MDAHKQPLEDADSSQEKKLNCLTEDLEKLNIAPDAENDKQNIPADVKEDSEYIQRGPTGGIPAQPIGLMRDKTLPIGPAGNYVAPQMHFTQNQFKGNRRLIEEAEDQPQKYFRPPPFQCDYGNVPQQCFQQQPNFPQKYRNFQGTNDLSQPMCHPTMTPQMFNFAAPGNEGFQFGQQAQQITTDLRNTNNMSGGKVTVQSPVANTQSPFPAGNIVDDFLDGLAEQQVLSTISQGGNMPNFTNGQLGSNSKFPANNFENDFSKDSFKEMRRRSDPDSGIESEGGSPWSEQAPSPGSVYASPPSVESGVGQSPMHESQYSYGVSPPKYPGPVTSPGSYRGTPSPANTSGYGSPGQPQHEDLNEALLEDAMEVIKADLRSTEESKKKQKHPSASSQQSIPQMVSQMIPVSANLTQPAMVSQQLTQGILRPPAMIPQVQGQQLPPATITTTGFIPVTTSGAPQQIIILPAQNQQNSNQPVILVPLQNSPAPQKKTGQTQFKKILPKLSQAPNSSTSGATSMSVAGGTGQTVVSMSNKGGKNSNRNQQNLEGNVND